MKLFVGIDVSSKDLVTSMISEETTEVVFQGNFVNDLKGATELKTTIIDMANSNHLNQAVNGSYFHLQLSPRNVFQKDQDLKKFDTQSVVIGPKKTKRYHNVLTEDKNDQNDVFYIADFLRVGRIVRQATLY